MEKSPVLVLAIFTALVLTIPVNAYALVYPSPITITNPAPGTSNNFGFSVSISGNNFVVGAIHNDVGAPDAGSAYLFSTTGPLATFSNPTPASNDEFGYSVSISGNNILIGARFDDTGAGDAGSAYLFDNTGALLQTFNNPTPAVGDQFGFSVAISGNNILIGAPFDDTSASNAGIAYLYDTSGALLQTITNPTPAMNEEFGSTVSADGNNLLVGAYRDSTGGGAAGSAYLFDTTGALLKTFNNPAPAVGDWFGWSVSISGNKALFGARLDDAGASNAGTAYLFDTSGVLLQTFNNPTPVASDEFGYSVSLSGSNVLVGAYRDDTGISNAGSAYLFDGTTGALLQTFNNPTPGSSDEFGNSVSISGYNVLVGAHRDTAGFGASGAAHLFLDNLEAFCGPIASYDAVITGTAGNDFLVATVKSIIVGDAGDDQILGSDFDDCILGDAGNDRVSAGLGNDKISGFGGDDSLVGGPGNDSIFGGAGNDRISGGAGNDVADGDDGNDSINGSADNDTLRGGIGADRISGGPGDDNIFGNADGDQIAGRADNDAIDCGTETDTAAGDDANPATNPADVDVLNANCEFASPF